MPDDSKPNSGDAQSAPTAHDSAEERRRLHEALPDLEVVELLLADINGVPRGKWLPARALDKLFTEGVRLPRGTFALDLWGEEVAASGLLYEIGDPDAICWPVPGSLRPVTWASRSTAQLLVSMREVDGRPFFGDPRQLLASLQARLAERGITPVVAVELEFSLFDSQPDAAGRPQPARSARYGGRPLDTQLYGLDELHAFGDFFTAVEHASQAQGVPTDTVITENAPGQYEINLHHERGALAACDHALMLRRIIKNVAVEQGLLASFMAKPFGNAAGNGMHVHISLVDAAGHNLFVDGSESGSTLMGQSLAGLLDSLPDGMPLFAPHYNSYRRFRARAQAPTACCWGLDNRNAALRVPRNAGEAIRIEHRVAGADANPYLVLAAMLAGILHGIEAQLTPPAAETGEPAAGKYPPLADDWGRALDRLRVPGVLRAQLGDAFCDLYLACKDQEMAAVADEISDVEYRRYLRQA